MVLCLSTQINTGMAMVLLLVLVCSGWSGLCCAGFSCSCTTLLWSWLLPMLAYSLLYGISGYDILCRLLVYVTMSVGIVYVYRVTCLGSLCSVVGACGCILWYTQE